MYITHDLNLYQQLVDTKANINSNEILPNAGEMHAAIAISKLFDKTTEKVRMVVDSFSSKVCDQSNYLDSLRKCIEKGVKFQVIFLGKRNESSKAYSLLKTAGDNVQFFDANDAFKSQLTKDGALVNFSVFDDDKFRFETNTEKFVAWFSFNDKTNASSLIKTFNLGILN